MPNSFAFALCADDYAMTPGVSRGIIEAIEAGSLTATSVMTTSQWWPDAAPALKRHERHLDIGLHLNLTLGSPLGAMPSLAPHGALPDIRTLMRLGRRRRLPVAEIAEEIERQCARFEEVMGRAPDHVDGHQHVQSLPAIRSLLLDALDRRGWRPWLRDSSDRVWRIPWRGGVKKALALCVVAEGFGSAVSRRGFARNDGFAGFSSFDPSEDYAALFGSYLNRPGRRHLIMCHPGYVDDALRALDPVLETREQELRFLTTGLADLLKRRPATLTRLSMF
jgi:predicted glycoside hydrolase/deacetylase ChbG (UPF0249 family)